MIGIAWKTLRAKVAAPCPYGSAFSAHGYPVICGCFAKDLVG
jgi:hypothetical protein